jgi:septum formation protein
MTVGFFLMTPTTELILASASPRRRILLGLLGHPFRVVVSGADESLIDEPTPERHAMMAAEAKFIEIATRESAQAAIIASDTVVCFPTSDDPGAPWHILGKPTDNADAVRMLTTLQGRTHRVVTAISIGWAGETPRTVAETADVTFRPASEDEIRRYVETGEPLDKAGSYGIQGGGRRFIARVEGDLTTVIGLPLERLAGLLEPFVGPLTMPGIEVVRHAFDMDFDIPCFPKTER